MIRKAGTATVLPAARGPSMRSRATRSPWLSPLIPVLALPTLLGAAQPPGWEAELASMRLEPARAVSLRATTLPLGLARLDIERAVLFPASPARGRTLEIVLVGQARFRIDPPDEIEAAQLELFTGRRALDTAVEEAVLVVADPAIAARLLDGPAPRGLPPALLERAEAAFRRWREGPERRRAGVVSSEYRALADDPALASYFALACRSHELGDFFYQLDPEDPEPLTLASFVPLDVRGWDRMRLAREIRLQQRKGRFLGLRVEDFGAWDVWLSAAWRGNGAAPPGQVGFESRHYELDATVARGDHRLEGRARLALEALDDGRTTVPLELHPDLIVRSVFDGTGRPLGFLQSGYEVTVRLAEPSRAGARLELDVAYGGQILQWVGRGVFDLVDTDDWYPHCGSVDRATYDVTLRWPARYEVLTGGSLEGVGRRGNYRWQRRRIDTPSIAASFVLGDLRLDRRRVGDVELTLGLERAVGTEALERTAAAVADALEFLTGTFGRLPVDELSVAVLPRDYSQSYLGLLTLTDSVLDLGGFSPPGFERWTRETTVAHELAHQWWGNFVGWASYRDQWLSEAMANYAGLLFSAARRGEPSPLTGLSAGWRRSLENLTGSGRPVGSIGPVVLGHRLNSSVAGAYRAIVYRKGAVVLAMLARVVGPERFLDTLRALLAESSGRVLSTESFLEAVARAADVDLGGFASTFVYGTGIPLVYFDWTAARAGAGWVVRGEARRRAQVRHVVSLVDAGHDSGWDVVRRAELEEETQTGTIRVPFSVGAPRASRQGEVLLRGTTSRFEVETDVEPSVFQLDPAGEILARFVSEQEDPKRFARLQAEEQMARGDAAAAAALLRRALGADAVRPPAGDPLPWQRNWETERRREDARAHLGLARLELGAERDAAARVEVEAADELIESDWDPLQLEVEALAARIELRRGEAGAAHKRMKRALRPGTIWRGETATLAEAWTIFAAAAAHAGHAEDCTAASATAREHGARLDGLDCAATRG